MSVTKAMSIYNQGVSMSQVNSAISEATSQLATGYTPKGPASVATLNGLTGQENGWLYTMTDAGTLTDGSLAVVAGDTVAWDATNEVWYKTNQNTLIVQQIKTATTVLIDLNDTSFWDVGGINSNTGNYSSSYADRLIAKPLFFTCDQVINFTKAQDVSFNYAVYCYSKDDEYLGYVPGGANLDTVVAQYPNASKFRFGLTNIVGAEVSVDNLENIVSFNNDVNVLDVVQSNEVSRLEDEISAVADSVEKVFDDKTENINLNSSDLWNACAINDTSGEEETSSDCLTSDFIRFTSDSVLTYSRRTGVSCSRMNYCYDINKRYLGKIIASSINDAKTRYEDAELFRVSITDITGATVSAENINNIVNFYGTAKIVIDGYETRLENIEKEIGGFFYQDPLKGKKWYACGDSFTEGVTDGRITQDGPYKGYKCVYPYFIGNRTGMDVHNIAVSGSSMTYDSETSTATNCFSYPSTGKYLSIPSDADYITLKFGINDDPSHKNMPLGTISDNTNTTLYGAWNVVIAHLLSACPHAKIGIIVTNGANEAYSKAGKDIAERWGLGYLDENFDYKVPLLIRVTGKPNVSSVAKDIVQEKMRVSENNTHPNDWAHEYESTIVEAWLRSL